MLIIYEIKKARKLFRTPFMKIVLKRKTEWKKNTYRSLLYIDLLLPFPIMEPIGIILIYLLLYYDKSFDFAIEPINLTYIKRLILNRQVL